MSAWKCGNSGRSGSPTSFVAIKENGIQHVVGVGCLPLLIKCLFSALFYAWLATLRDCRKFILESVSQLKVWFLWICRRSSLCSITSITRWTRWRTKEHEENDAVSPLMIVIFSLTAPAGGYSLLGSRWFVQILQQFMVTSLSALIWRNGCEVRKRTHLKPCQPMLIWKTLPK